MRIRVGVIFGGRSSEHEVSIVSAQAVIERLDPSKYEIVPIGITKEGCWITEGDPVKTLKDAVKLPPVLQNAQIPITVQSDKAIAMVGKDKPIDVFFPVLHGTYGEDGAIQGLLEMLGVPYVGCNVLASALGMDKAAGKTIWAAHGLPLAKYITVSKAQWHTSQSRVVTSIESDIRFPCFVKPSAQGSSIGVHKVKRSEDLVSRIEDAFTYDDMILVEEGIDARELECAVLGNDHPEASIVGEIVPSAEFYDYENKYVDGTAQSVIPAKISAAVMKQIQQLAVQAFTLLRCTGMARVDFFMDKATERIYLNELNTIPGFTSISMYPKMWEASGLTYPQLLDKLITLAMERFQARTLLRTSFSSNSDWYK